MEEAKRLVKHVLLLKFKEDTTSRQQIDQVIRDYANVWGTDVSVGNKYQGFAHIFESTSRAPRGVTEYLLHPAHVDFADLYLPLLDKFFVFDYKPTVARI